MTKTSYWLQKSHLRPLSVFPWYHRIEVIRNIISKISTLFWTMQSTKGWDHRFPPKSSKTSSQEHIVLHEASWRYLLHLGDIFLEQDMISINLGLLFSLDRGRDDTPATLESTLQSVYVVFRETRFRVLFTPEFCTRAWVSFKSPNYLLTSKFSSSSKEPGWRHISLEKMGRSPLVLGTGRAGCLRDRVSLLPEALVSQILIFFLLSPLPFLTFG